MTTLSTHIAIPSPARPLFARLLQLRALSRERNALKDLDQHLLDDIGITRAEAMTEAQRPSWDAPTHWLR